MKNITLSIEEEVLASARRYAVARDATVNSLVREYLKQIAQQENSVKKARTRLKKLSEKSEARTGKKDWSRDSLHER